MNPVTYEARMTNGRKVTLTKTEITEILERDGGGTVVRTKTGGYYHLTDKYDKVQAWFACREA